ncbi:hypothetical protein ABID59_006224 [Bradyrhizobium sp. S3.3.6]
MWYLGAIALWLLISGVLGGSGAYAHPGDVLIAIAFVSFFYVGWWLPYITWLALGELGLFANYPDRKSVFYVFAALSFAVYSFLVFRHPKWSDLWPLLIYPAAAVTVMYIARRSRRRA